MPTCDICGKYDYRGDYMGKCDICGQYGCDAHLFSCWECGRQICSGCLNDEGECIQCEEVKNA